MQRSLVTTTSNQNVSSTYVKCGFCYALILAVVLLFYTIMTMKHPEVRARNIILSECRSILHHNIHRISLMNDELEWSGDVIEKIQDMKKFEF